MSTYATVEDVRARYGGDASDTRIQAFLDDAEAIVTARFPDIEARIAGGVTSAAAVRVVVISMTLRALVTTPIGLLSEAAGPFSEPIDAGYRGYLRIQRDEIQMLGGAPRAAGRAFTIKPANEPDSVCDDGWRYFLPRGWPDPVDEDLS